MESTDKNSTRAGSFHGESNIYLLPGYDGYITEREIGSGRLFELYGIYRQYMIDENELIHQRSVRGAGAQALVGTALGAILSLEDPAQIGLILQLATQTALNVGDVLLLGGLTICLVGLAAAISTSLSVRAAYDAIDCLSQDWQRCVSFYLTKRLVTNLDKKSRTKAELLPSLVGGGKSDIHVLGSYAPKILSYSSVLLWLAMTVVILFALIGST